MAESPVEVRGVVIETPFYLGHSCKSTIHFVPWHSLTHKSALAIMVRDLLPRTQIVNTPQARLSLTGFPTAAHMPEPSDAQAPAHLEFAALRVAVPRDIWDALTPDGEQWSHLAVCVEAVLIGGFWIARELVVLARAIESLPKTETPAQGRHESGPDSMLRAQVHSTPSAPAQPARHPSSAGTSSDAPKPEVRAGSGGSPFAALTRSNNPSSQRTAANANVGGASARQDVAKPGPSAARPAYKPESKGAPLSDSDFNDVPY